jgi:HAD superfamily hydrolase (TIGR01450 family)
MSGVGVRWAAGLCYEGTMPGWAFDLDGVLWRGATPIPGGVAAVRTLQARRDPVVFVTNFSYSPVAELEGRLDALGIAGRGAVITSAQAAASLVAPGERALVCAGPGVAEALEQRGATVVHEGAADVVVVGYDPAFDYHRLTVACRAVWGGARLVGTNGDTTYPGPEGLLPGGGALVAAVATATGVEPTIAGKPHAPMVALVRDRTGPDGVMVGDRADTDGGFARALGYRFALVLSGVTSDAAHLDPSPDLVADDASGILALVDAEAVPGSRPAR